ncbi:MAG: phenylacetate--CoA ligase family protein, partial [Euryarchaeota archaeon]|nr:phenylacetate--CoA ligase family protein [Euryarchaeota archaeon]
QVKTAFRSDPELRRSIGKTRLDEVTRDDLREYQLHRFREQLRYTEENSIYYKSALRKAGVDPREIKSFEDLTKVPLTEPAEVAKEPFHFLCVSQGKVMRAFTTSGTSGLTKRIFFTRDDVLRIIDSISAALKTVGLKEEDTLQIMFPTIASWDPGYMLDGACKLAGLHSVIADMLDVDEQMRIMKESRTTMMIGLTSFIYRVTVLARGRYDLRSFGMKAAILSAEPLPEAMRREIEEAWGCKALSQYGLTEMGLATTVECPAQDGLHVNDADFLVEAIDPESGEHVGPREAGELVITSLNYQGTPLIRYRTYDLSSIIDPPCGCGLRTIGKVGKIRGRLDMMTKVGFGEKVYPLLFDEAVLSVSGVVNYQTLIEREGYRDRLRFRVEFLGDKEEGRRRIEGAILQLPEIRSGLENDLLEPPVVEMVDEGGLEFAPKTLAIVDSRRLYD